MNKASLVEHFASTLHLEAAEAHSFDTVVAPLKLAHIVDFDVVLRHEVTTKESKNVNATRATLIFKIGQIDGSIETRRIDCSLAEVAKIKKELQRVEETLS